MVAIVSRIYFFYVSKNLEWHYVRKDEKLNSLCIIKKKFS